MFGMSKASPAPKTAPKPARKPSLVAVTVKLEAKQRDKLKALGGDAWLRERIDAAQAPGRPDPKASPFALDDDGH